MCSTYTGYPASNSSECRITRIDKRRELDHYFRYIPIEMGDRSIYTGEASTYNQPRGNQQKAQMMSSDHDTFAEYELDPSFIPPEDAPLAVQLAEIRHIVRENRALLQELLAATESPSRQPQPVDLLHTLKLAQPHR